MSWSIAFSVSVNVGEEVCKDVKRAVEVVRYDESWRDSGTS